MNKNISVTVYLAAFVVILTSILYLIFVPSVIKFSESQERYMELHNSLHKMRTQIYNLSELEDQEKQSIINQIETDRKTYSSLELDKDLVVLEKMVKQTFEKKDTITKQKLNNSFSLITDKIYADFFKNKQSKDEFIQYLKMANASLICISLIMGIFILYTLILMFYSRRTQNNQ